MEDKILARLNHTTIHDILKNFIQNSLLLFNDIEIINFGLIACAFLLIMVTGLFIFHRVKDKYKNKNYNTAITKVNKLKKYSVDSSKSKNFDYRKILNEFHNLCNNCTNIFSSMKCIELISNYPELINISLSDGLTPFHRVCFQGNDVLIEYMLVKGADPELKTVNGENALCMTLYHYLYTKTDKFNCLETLYDNGCYLSYTDDWYKIFLNLSIKNNNTNLTRWLITHSKYQKGGSFTKSSSVPL